MANVKPNAPDTLASTPIESKKLQTDKTTEPLARPPKVKSHRELDQMADSAASRAFGEPVGGGPDDGDAWTGGGGYNYRMDPAGHVVVTKEGRRPVNVSAGTDMFQAIMKERGALGAAPAPGGPQELAGGGVAPVRTDMAGQEMPLDTTTPWQSSRTPEERAAHTYQLAGKAMAAGDDVRAWNLLRGIEGADQWPGVAAQIAKLEARNPHFTGAEPPPGWTPSAPPEELRRAGDEPWPSLADAQAERDAGGSGLATTLQQALGL